MAKNIKVVPSLGTIQLSGSNANTSISVTDDGQLQFGESSNTGSLNVTGDLVVQGSVTAQEFKTEFVSASIIYRSGSTKFGDTSDDTHSFTGSLEVSGSIESFGELNFTSTTANTINSIVNLTLNADSDSNSGDAYRNIIFKNRDTETARINADGYLGIGTSSPSSKLTVDGKVTVDHVIGSLITGSVQEWNSYSGVSGNTKLDLKIGRGSNNKVAIFQATYEGGGYSNIILQDQGGNVGIGTTSPSVPLEVKQGDTTQIISDRNGNGTNIVLKRSGATRGVLATSNISGQEFELYSSSDLILNASTGNNVGIGTTSPQVKLHVAGRIRSTYAGNTAFYSGNYVRLFNSQAYEFRNSGGSSVAQINLSGNSYFNGGNVGIGTTSPSSILEISDDTPILKITDNRNLNVGDWDDVSLGALQFATSDTTSPGARALAEIEAYSGVGAASGPEAELIFKTSTITDSSPVQRMVIDSDGRLGLGTTNPGETFQIHDTSTTSNPKIKIFGYDTATSSAKYGQLFVGTDGSFNITAQDTYLILGAGNYIQSNSTHAFIQSILQSNNKGVRMQNTQGNYNTVLIADSNNIVKVGAVGTVWPTGGDLALYSSGSEKVRINSSGYVGIGVTSPGTVLHVASERSDFVAKFSHTVSSGYAPGSIMLQAGQSTSRGQGLFHYNTEADQSWFTGVPYAVSSKKWIVATKPDTTFDPAVAQTSHALLQIDADTGDVDITHNLTVGGIVTAQEFHTEFVSASIIYQSGSTKFGDTSDDTHSFTGSLGILSGSLTLGGPTPLFYIKDSTLDTTHQLNSNNSELQIKGDQAIEMFADNTSSLYIASDGDIGIGTDAIKSGVKLHVLGTSRPALFDSSTLVSTVKITNSGTGNGVYNGLDIVVNSTSDNNIESHGMPLAFSTSDTNGVQAIERMRITGDGKVGIGTTNPAYKLTVAGDTYVYNSNLHLNNGYGIVNAGNISNKAGFPSIGNFAFENVNVGIGTTNPQTPLHVNGHISSSRVYTSDDVHVGDDLFVEGNLIRLTGAGTNYIQTTNGDLKIQTAAGDDVILRPGGTDNFIFKDSGNLGIGNTNPTHTVEIGTDGGGEKILKMHSDTASSYFEIQSLGNVARLLATNNTNLLLQSDGTGGYITFNANSAERMRIDSSGRLLLNSTSTSFSDKLYINGDAYVNGAWRVGTSGTYIGKLYNTLGILTLESDSTRDIQFGSVTNGTAMFIEGTNGNVGIGVTNPGDFNSAATNLVVGTGAGSNGITVYSGTSSAGGLYFADESGSGAGNRDGVVNYNHSSATMDFKTGGNQRVLSLNTGTSTFNLGDVVMENDLTVKGIVTAQEFHTEFVSASIIYQSGSTKFGDTSDDVHSFTGSLKVKTGDLFLDYNRHIGAGTAYNNVWNRINMYNGSNGDMEITMHNTGWYLRHNANMSIDGNVGIGTTLPTEKLTVEGNISSSGNITTTGAVKLDGQDGLWFNQGGSSVFSPSPGIFYSGQSGQGWYFQVPDNGQEKFSFKLGGLSAGREFRVVDPSWNPLFQVQGTGDAVIANNLTVGGIVTAQEFHTEFVSASIIYQSGSTKFGDTSDDNHDFTGSVNILGPVTATSFTGSLYTTPTAPTNLSLTQEDGTVVVQFTSASGEVHRYEVWSSVGDETNYNLIGALNEDNFTASIQIVDDTFNKNDTIYYTVYSLRNGKYSDSLTGNIAVTGNVADVTGMRVMESLHGYHLEWVLPDDNRLQQVNVKVDSSATLAGLSEANSTTFYSGLAEQTFYEVPEADANKYHQFWIDSVTRT